MTKNFSIATILFLLAATTTIVIAQSNAKDKSGSICSVVSAENCPMTAALVSEQSSDCTGKSSCEDKKGDCAEKSELTLAALTTSEPLTNKSCDADKGCDKGEKSCETMATCESKCPATQPVAVAEVTTQSEDCPPCCKSKCDAESKAVVAEIE